LPPPGASFLRGGFFPPKFCKTTFSLALWSGLLTPAPGVLSRTGTLLCFCFFFTIPPCSFVFFLCSPALDQITVRAFFPLLFDGFFLFYQPAMFFPSIEPGCPQQVFFCPPPVHFPSSFPALVCSGQMPCLVAGFFFPLPCPVFFLPPLFAFFPFLALPIFPTRVFCQGFLRFFHLLLLGCRVNHGLSPFLPSSYLPPRSFQCLDWFCFARKVS